MFTDELEAWQSQVMYGARFDEYRALPFDQFVTGLHGLVKTSALRREQEGLTLDEYAR